MFYAYFNKVTGDKMNDQKLEKKKTKPDFLLINGLVREMLIEGRADFHSDTLECDDHVFEEHNMESAGLCVSLEWADGMTGYRSWFYHNGVMVCLGCDLTNKLPDNEDVLVSCAELCRSDKPSYNGKPLAYADSVISDNTAVCNGRFAYYNLDTSKPFRISVYRKADNEQFKAYFVHGINPQGHSYSYAVTLNDADMVPLSAAELPIVSVINRAELQAVEFTDGFVVAVFHDTDESMTLSNGEILMTERPNRIILKKVNL